jgi:hypothetical protein
MAYIVLCLKHSLRGFYSCLRSAHLLNWETYLNLGDILFVVAEKIGSGEASPYQEPRIITQPLRDD